MTNLFVDVNEEIRIDIVVGEDKEGNILCEPKKDAKEIEKSVVNGLQDYCVFFRKPSFGDLTNISGDSISIDVNSGVSFNFLELRMNKIKTLLKKWNLKDNEGNPVSPTEENVEKLHPSIAATIGSELDLATGGAGVQ